MTGTTVGCRNFGVELVPSASMCGADQLGRGGKALHITIGIKRWSASNIQRCQSMVVLIGLQVQQN